MNSNTHNKNQHVIRTSTLNPVVEDTGSGSGSGNGSGHREPSPPTKVKFKIPLLPLGRQTENEVPFQRPQFETKPQPAPRSPGTTTPQNLPWDARVPKPAANGENDLPPAQWGTPELRMWERAAKARFEKRKIAATVETKKAPRWSIYSSDRLIMMNRAENRGRVMLRKATFNEDMLASGDVGLTPITGGKTPDGDDEDPEQRNPPAKKKKRSNGLRKSKPKKEAAKVTVEERDEDECYWSGKFRQCAHKMFKVLMRNQQDLQALDDV